MNTPMHPTTHAHRAARAAGFTLIELMVAMTLGMLLTAAMAYVYISGRSAFSRQQQLGSVQQSVRTAFEYLGNDARMAGHLGCFNGLSTVATTKFNNNLSATSVATNYAIGVEGYEYINATAGQYTMTSSVPANVTTAGSWRTQLAANGIATLPLAAIAGTGSGLTPGSDVLVIRKVSGRPVRLAADANTGSNQTSFTVETKAAEPGAANCSNGTTARVSGFCTNSHALIASCSRARIMQIGSIVAGTAPAASTLNLAASTNLGNDPIYTPIGAEVFPMQTIAYYVKQSSSGTTTSLYRRIFDGDLKTPVAGGNDDGLEQELVEGVESLQIQYGVDTTTPVPNGVVDQYVVARGPTGDSTDSVTDWNRVVTIRIGVLVRATQPIDNDLASALPASAPVNGVDIIVPTSGRKFDRRVFTTTVAVRNRIP